MRGILLVIMLAPFVSGAVAAAGGPDTTSCRAWQECNGNAIALKALGVPPTRIVIMPSRYQELVNAKAGLESTKVLGVESQNGQFTNSDEDLGLFLIVPWLAVRLHVPVALAFDWFVCGMIAICCVLGISGFFFLTSRPWPRIVATVVVILISVMALSIGDSYFVLGAAPLGLVPWIVLAVRRSSLWQSIATGLIAGCLAVIADSVRSFTGVILLVFLTIVWGFSRTTSFRVRGAGLASAFVACVLVGGALHAVIVARDAFLRRHAPQSSHPTLNSGHQFWHTAYIGLGYVKNPDVPAYKDEVGVAKVCSINPNVDFYSAAYLQILKSSTLQIARDHPGLIVEEVTKKGLVELIYILVFANIGWIAFARRPIAWPVDIAFFVAIAINALFGILAVPARTYLFGMIAYSALFGATSVILWADEGLRGLVSEHLSVGGLSV